MNKMLAIFAIFVAVTSCAETQRKTGSFTQEKAIPKEAFEKLANDLAQLQEEMRTRADTNKLAQRGATTVDSIMITKGKTEVYAGADVKAKTLGMVTHGESPFPIIDKQPGWYAIDLVGAKWSRRGQKLWQLSQVG